MVRRIYRFDELFINRIFVSVESFIDRIDFIRNSSLIDSVESAIYNLFVDLILPGQDNGKREREKRKSILEEHFSLPHLLVSRSPLLYPFSTRNPTLASRTSPPSSRRLFSFRHEASPFPKQIKTTSTRMESSFLTTTGGLSLSLFSKPTWNSWRLGTHPGGDGRKEGVGGHLRVNMSPADPALWSRIAL